MQPYWIQCPQTVSISVRASAHKNDALGSFPSASLLCTQEAYRWTWRVLLFLYSGGQFSYCQIETIKGIYFVCLFCCLNSEVTDCDLELIINELCSSFVNVNMKSGGNLSKFEIFGYVSICDEPIKDKEFPVLQ